MSDTSLRAAVARLGLLLILCAVTPFARAIPPADLPPVDQVFGVSARATAPDRIELRWTIAKGFYLYRHQLKVQADGNFGSPVLHIPAGAKHRDEFFGDVETYRESLTVPVTGVPRGASTVLTVRYQGCADAGLCYPPTTKTLRVSLPAPSSSASDASASAGSPFGALSRGGDTGLTNGVSDSGVSGGGLLGARGGSVSAADQALPAAQAFQVSARVEGSSLRVTLAPAPGYYLYRNQIRVRTAAGSAVRLGAPVWPAARLHDDPEFGKVPVYFSAVDLRVPLTASAASSAAGSARGGSVSLPVTVDFQGCKDQGVCYPPMSRRFEVSVTPSALAAAPVTGAVVGAATGAAAAAAAAAVDPASSGTGAAGTTVTETVIAPPDATATATDTTTPAGPAIADTGAALPTAPPAGAPPISAALALLLALLGGLALNLMPCVLPVLSLKAIGLANQAAHPASARRHALAYTAGVLASFAALGGLMLALRGLGDAVGWAFQMQQPLVVGFLALLMFALGLSLNGVWHAGGRWLGMGQSLTQAPNWKGDFFTGLLAVVVATPCIAPFMGAALAWALFAPAALAVLVFVAIGLGMALPFLLIGFIPALARFLPRPGAWMDTFKHWMAFPMYLSAIWLAWVVGQQRGPLGMAWLLVAALLIAIACWAWTRAAQLSRPTHRVLALAALALALLTLVHVHRLPALSSPSSPSSLSSPSSAVSPSEGTPEAPIPFDRGRIADLRAQGKTVFVNITADWCISCKVNERAVLHTAAFATMLRDANAVYMVGDYTNVSDDLTAYLGEFRAVGVPLYVVYPPTTRSAATPRVLPTILTRATVRDALPRP